MCSSDALLLSRGAAAAPATGSIELAHAATATQEARLSALFRKLDRCGGGDHALLGKFELLGPAERCLGGVNPLLTCFVLQLLLMCQCLLHVIDA